MRGFSPSPAPSDNKVTPPSPSHEVEGAADDKLDKAEDASPVPAREDVEADAEVKMERERSPPAAPLADRWKRGEQVDNDRWGRNGGRGGPSQRNDNAGEWRSSRRERSPDRVPPSRRDRSRSRSPARRNRSPSVSAPNGGGGGGASASRRSVPPPPPRNPPGTTLRNSPPPPEHVLYRYHLTFPFRKVGGLFNGPEGSNLARLKRASGVVELEIRMTEAHHAVAIIVGSKKAVRRALDIIESAQYKEALPLHNDWEAGKLRDRRWIEYIEKECVEQQGIWVDDEFSEGVKEDDPIPFPFFEGLTRNSLDFADQDLPHPPNPRFGGGHGGGGGGGGGRGPRFGGGGGGPPPRGGGGSGFGGPPPSGPRNGGYGGGLNQRGAPDLDGRWGPRGGRGQYRDPDQDRRPSPPRRGGGGDRDDDRSGRKRSRSLSRSRSRSPVRRSPSPRRSRSPLPSSSRRRDASRSRSRSRSPARRSNRRASSPPRRSEKSRRLSNGDRSGRSRRGSDARSKSNRMSVDPVGGGSGSQAVEREIPIPSSAAARFLAPSTSAAFIEETTGCVVSLQSRRSGSSLLVEAPSKKALEQALFDLERVVAKVEDGWKLPA